jgi:hypothetical protein
MAVLYHPDTPHLIERLFSVMWREMIDLHVVEVARLATIGHGREHAWR